MGTTADKDSEQDEMIRRNSERISRNEEAILRQTEALEKIRDHYYPRKRWWKKLAHYFGKVVCIIVAYLGIAEAVDWLWNVRESQRLAEQYAAVARQLFFEEGNAIGAAELYEKCIQLDGENSKYRIARSFMKGLAFGTDLFEQHRLLTADERARVDESLAEAIALKKLEPKNPMPHVLMAQALLLRGERDEAAAAVDHAVCLDPKDASVRISACAIRFFVGQPKEARAQFAEAERLDPTLPLALCWKGLLAMALDHDGTAARSAFEALTRRAPRLPLGYALLGKALLAEEKPDMKAVRAAFRRALVLDSKQKIALLGLGEAAMREDNRALARLWYDRTLVQDPNDITALEARARLNGLDGDWTAAIADWTAAIALAPFRAELYRGRAEAYVHVKDGKQAALDCKTADALGDKTL